MYKVLVWGTGSYYGNFLTLLQINIQKRSIEVVGITSNELRIKEIDGFTFIPKGEISHVEFDYCLAAVADVASVWKEAEKYGIEKRKIIPISVLAIPYFDFEQYIYIKEANISIMSQMCFGGILSNKFGLEFMSPTVNMYFTEKDFLKFMANTRWYIEQKVEFERWEWEDNLCRKYPVGSVGDIQLFFNHYATWEEAKDCWNRRKKRINFDNMLYIAYTREPEFEKEFNSLDIDRKIIFVPYSTNEPASVEIICKNSQQDSNFGMDLNEIAIGKGNQINLFHLLLGKGNLSRIRT